MARSQDRGVGPESSFSSFERGIAARLQGAHIATMGHATALRRGPVGLRERTAERLHELHAAAERGDDIDAIGVLVATVTAFVFSIVGIVTAITLTLYLTVG